MAIVVFYEKETDTKAKITMIHNQPHDNKNGLPREQIDKGIEKTEMPIKEDKRGKIALPYINPRTGEIWYEYVDRPLTEEERLNNLEARIEKLEKSIRK